MDKDGNWLWAKNLGSDRTDRANSIAIDICDDVYITGEYRNPMVFPGANASNGTDTLSHKQKRDVFVAKMNNQGDWKWAKRARSSGTDKAYQMSVDANKQVFVCGTMGDTARFTNSLVVPAPIPGDTTASAWVAQIDGASNTGDWLWAKMAGSNTDDDRTGDICPDGFGNVYAIGFFEDSADFDGTILNSLGRKDIFVWKMSMIAGNFTYNNTYNTIIVSDSLVSSPLDTGLFLQSSSFVIDGCDTAFVNSVIHLILISTWDCISAGNCQDPGNGTGAYASLSGCQSACMVTAIQEQTTTKRLLKVTDILGRETKGTKNEVLFYIYDDGTVEKRIVIE
jgi:hypothetical protein